MSKKERFDIGIVGYGIVGKAVEYGFKENNNILFYDKFKKESSPLEEVVNKSDFIFMCLPTPFKNERIDLSIMDEAMKEITKITNNTDKIIIIKSTVVPGTTRNYSKTYPQSNFCFNPEFLTEKNPNLDFVKSDRIIIGADNNHVVRKVADLYRGTFPETPMFLTDPTTAEMVKYMANCLLATRVSFANEMCEMCEKLGIKYEAVKEMVIADKRMGSSHLDITSNRGFGGKCLPKDIVALIGLYKEKGVDCSILESVWKKNLRIRKYQDWNDIPFVNTNKKKTKKNN